MLDFLSDIQRELLGAVLFLLILFIAFLLDESQNVIMTIAGGIGGWVIALWVNRSRNQ